MQTPLEEKSSLEEIRARFDADVERFSVLETGQQSTIDAPLAMELITRAAVAATPRMKRVLDIGCGAGNNTLRLLGEILPLDCDLLDLSQPMLDRALERVSAINTGQTRVIRGDFRDVALPGAPYDVIFAAAVLHHLRDDSDWLLAFTRLHDLLAPGGSLWITDLVTHSLPEVDRLMWDRYGEYLAAPAIGKRFSPTSRRKTPLARWLGSSTSCSVLDSAKLKSYTRIPISPPSGPGNPPQSRPKMGQIFPRNKISFYVTLERGAGMAETRRTRSSLSHEIYLCHWWCRQFARKRTRCRLAGDAPRAPRP
jgi:tRNA (cmo5U34)-methyltransferase